MSAMNSLGKAARRSAFQTDFRRTGTAGDEERNQ